MQPLFARRFGALVADAASGASLRIERRAAPRSPCAGTLTGAYTDGRGTMGIAPLEVFDSSSTGLGVRSVSPIRPGMIIALRPAGRPAHRWVSAIAVRAVKEGGAYLVGLRVTSRARAA